MNGHFSPPHLTNPNPLALVPDSRSISEMGKLGTEVGVGNGRVGMERVLPFQDLLENGDAQRGDQRHVRTGLEQDGQICRFHGTAGDAGGDLVGERMELEEDGQEWVCKLDSGREMDLYLSRMEKFFFQKW